MGIGQRRQVQLVQVINAKGAHGEWIEQTPDVVFGVWAEIASPSGSRSYEHGQTQLGNTKFFQIRFRFDKYPGADWKIRYEGKDWTISQLTRVDEKRFYWSMTATSKGNV